MKQGVIVIYQSGHGQRHGFIKPLKGKELVFFHYSVVGDGSDLPIGTAVRFSAIRGPKGPQATLVTRK